MSHRVSANGSLRFDRSFKGVGRIARASGTQDERRFQALNQLLTELYEEGRLDLLRAVRDGRLSVRELYDGRRTGKLAALLDDVVLSRPLWDEVEAWLPLSAARPSTRLRYETSWRGLRRRRVLRSGAVVRDLSRVPWNRWKRDWPNSVQDWNRMRAAVSRFLTMTLDGDKLHPFRREVMKRLTSAKEPPGRVPALDTPTFWRLVEAMPEALQPSIVCLAVTGLRVGEYLALEERHLWGRSIHVPGTKTTDSQGVIYVGDDAWPWVVRAVPSPLRYKALYKHFKAAAAEVGQPDLRLHDLRHFHGQTLANAGLPESKIQQALRHATPAMTRRYTRQRDRGEAALAIDDALLGGRKGA